MAANLAIDFKRYSPQDYLDKLDFDLKTVNRLLDRDSLSPEEIQELEYAGNFYLAILSSAQKFLAKPAKRRRRNAANTPLRGGR
jgi:hypothetical protein